MVATTYQTSHECSEETIIDILVAGFSGQLKGWWDNYLTNEEKEAKRQTSPKPQITIFNSSSNLKYQNTIMNLS